MARLKFGNRVARHTVNPRGSSARDAETPVIADVACESLPLLFFGSASDDYRPMIWMPVATRIAMLKATMNKKNFPTAVPPASHNAEGAKWFVGTGD